MSQITPPYETSLAILREAKPSHGTNEYVKTTQAVSVFQQTQDWPQVVKAYCLQPPVLSSTATMLANHPVDMSFFLPTRFVWRYGGQQVFLIGSFTRWVETVPMAAVDKSPGVFAVVVHLPPGYHQYKFIVDGEWRHDERAPFMPDPIGNVNNWVFVGRSDTAAGNALLQQHQQQQQHPQQPAQQHQQQQLQQQKQYPILDQGTMQGSKHGSTNPIPAPRLVEDPVTQSQLEPPNSDVPMTDALLLRKEPEYTRSIIHDFLHSHTAFELIPESGKVVVLDIDLSVRQAFHALHEQGISSAAVWDSDQGTIAGVISASDFILALRQLRENISSGASALTAAEMDLHSIRTVREEARIQGRSIKELVYVEPEFKLQQVIDTLLDKKCSMAPIVTVDQDSERIPTVLHTATIAGVLGCIMRHFRASLASLPLLAEPLGRLPLGTWFPNVEFPKDEDHENTKVQGRDTRSVKPLHYVHPSTPLTSALALLLETKVSVLPVVDESLVLQDIYARSDITQLAKQNAYSRLQHEEMTVQQALSLSRQQPLASGSRSGSGIVGGLTAQLHGHGSRGSDSDWANGLLPPPIGGQVRSGQSQPMATSTRAHVVTRQDSLRTVVERLGVPGVRRLVVVDSSSRRLEGLISLSDIATYLFT